VINIFTVVIPSHNEAKNLPNIIPKMPKGCEIIVVDDRSTDRTSRVAKGLGCKVARIEKNGGKGAACILGAKIAKHNKIIFIDGDGQHDPVHIKKFVRALDNNDIVLGRRTVESIPIHRRISNSFASFSIFLITKRWFSDVLCGFRGIRRDKFLELNLKEKGYEIESEMLIKSCHARLDIGEVDIGVKYFSKKGMSLRASWRLAKYLINQIWHK